MKNTKNVIKEQNEQVNIPTSMDISLHRSKGKFSIDNKLTEIIPQEEMLVPTRSGEVVLPKSKPISKRANGRSHLLRLGTPRRPKKIYKLRKVKETDRDDPEENVEF